MTKKPPELPNIEDATLKACLAPLMEALNNVPDIAEPAPPVVNANDASMPVTPEVRPAGAKPRDIPGGGAAGGAEMLPHIGAGSNDNPPPSTLMMRPRKTTECPAVPKTLAEWRSLADDDFGAFRMIDQFLGMTDAELEMVAAQFPRQIDGTIGRIARIKQRLAQRYDMVATAASLLERAARRASASEGADQPPIKATLSRD